MFKSQLHKKSVVKVYFLETQKHIFLSIVWIVWSTLSLRVGIERIFVPHYLVFFISRHRPFCIFQYSVKYSRYSRKVEVQTYTKEYMALPHDHPLRARSSKRLPPLGKLLSWSSLDLKTSFSHIQIHKLRSIFCLQITTTMAKQTMFICHAQTPVCRPLSLMSLSISDKCVGKYLAKREKNLKSIGKKMSIWNYY